MTDPLAAPPSFMRSSTPRQRPSSPTTHTSSPLSHNHIHPQTHTIFSSNQKAITESSSSFRHRHAFRSLVCFRPPCFLSGLFFHFRQSRESEWLLYCLQVLDGNMANTIPSIALFMLSVCSCHCLRYPEILRSNRPPSRSQLPSERTISTQC